MTTGTPNDKVAIVTGCRSGFGLLVAKDVARAGYAVYAGLRDLSTAGELRAATEGLDVTPVQLDVTKADEREAVVKQVLEAHGRVDVLVNNAGIALGGPLEVVSEAEIRKVFDVNVFGVWALTNLVLPTMRAQGSGHILNISSISGRQALPFLGVYASSKFALEGMSEALRHELRHFGITVSLIEPGPFKTDIFGRNRTLAKGVETDTVYARFTQAMDRAYARVVERDAGDPQDVSDLVMRLITRPRRTLRYPIGKRVRLRTVASRVLPQGVIDRVIDRILLKEG